MDDMYADNQLPVVPIKDLAGWRGLTASSLGSLLDAYGPWTEPEHLAPRLGVDYWFREPDHGRRRTRSRRPA